MTSRVVLSMGSLRPDSFLIKRPSEWQLEIKWGLVKVKDNCVHAIRPFSLSLISGHTCGGVLISRKTVTTAAHCLFDGTRLRNAFDLRVVLGSLNRGIFTEETVTRTAEKIIVHPAYRRGESFANDIGLVFVRSSKPRFSHIYNI